MTAEKLVNAILIALITFATAINYVRLVSVQEVAYDIDVPQPEVIGDPIIDDAPVKPKEIPDELLAQETNCLAENIYHEAGNQPLRGQLAVAAVTLNRVSQYRFPDTVCDVVHQRSHRGNCEFTWICKGRRVDPNNPKFRETYELAENILTGETELEYLNNAVYYHSTRVYPWWARKKEFVGQIGAHKFYAERG
jgi:spore germination cell wall hydrolase CwlJ-like protein